MSVRSRALGAVAASALSLAAVVSLAACTSSNSAAPAANGSSGSSAASSAAAGGGHTMSVQISAAKGCELNAASFGSGPLTVNIQNMDATAVSEVELLSGERIVGEKENLPPGITGSFSVSVDPGSYQLYCPGATSERTPVTVTGAEVTTANTGTHQLLVTGTQEYASYVRIQTAALLTNTTAFVATLSKPNNATDLATAQAAYAKARVYYERIEPVAESFPQLDSDIDARVNDVPAGQWKGFHLLEKTLFQDKTLAGTPAIGATLLANVTKLNTETQTLTYKPFELANGASALLDEVATNKVTGEEERYSHIDLLDFAGNVEGAQQAFADLQPGLNKIDPTLTSTIAANFTALQNLLDKQRDASQPSGYKLYSSLSRAQITALAQANQAVAEPLSRVSSKVVNA